MEISSNKVWQVIWGEIHLYLEWPAVFKNYIIKSKKDEINSKQIRDKVIVKAYKNISKAWTGE